VVARLSRLIVAGLVALSLAAAAAAAQSKADADPMAAIADELLWGINRTGGIYDRVKVLITGVKPSIAVAPFDADKIPIGKPLADRYTENLLSELIRKAAGMYKFKPRAALIAIIDDMRETGVLDDPDRNPIAELLKRARADVLVTGKMALEGRELILSFKAVLVDGEVLVATRARRFPLTREQADATAATLTLEQGMREAVRHLAKGASDMTELRLGGVRFGDTGVQPPFGRYLEGLLSDLLQKAFPDVLTERRLVVRRAELGARQIAAMRGSPVEAEAMRRERFDIAPGVYLLTGKYWDFGLSVDVSVKLTDHEGTVVGWRDRVRADSLPPGMVLRPDKDLTELREGDGFGEIDFALTSARGKDPAYRIKERLDLLMRTDRDAWVYCFYFQADGKTVQIFPNPHFWTKYREPRLAGKILHTVPDSKLFPFELTLAEPTGEEAIKCFAVTRDVTDDLPEELRGRSLEPLPEDMAARLPRIFRGLRDAAVSEASLAITVTP
jgi:hypothetical protein